MTSPNTTDYTQRDFAAILAGMQSDVPLRTPELTNFNRGELAMVLLELFAGSLDVLSYSLDRAAGEAFLDTAITKGSVQNILRLIGYQMKRRVAATVQLQFSFANNATSISSTLIPKGTLIVSKSGLPFITVMDATIPAGENVAKGHDDNGIPNLDYVLAMQGQYNSHVIAPSGNTEELNYKFPAVNVAENYLNIQVNGETWTDDKNINEGLATGTDKHIYRTLEDVFGNTFIQFSKFIGDVPAPSDTIVATYVVTDGDVGNVGAGTINQIPTQPVSVPSGLTLTVVNNVQSSGGHERESIAEAKINGPRTLRTLDRAVTLQDYKDLLLMQTDVESVSAINHPGYVEIYVRPVADPVTGLFPQFKLESPLVSSVVLTAGGTIAAGQDVFLAFTSVDAAGHESSYIHKNPSTGVVTPSSPYKVKMTATGSLAVRLSTLPVGAVSVNIYVGAAPSAIPWADTPNMRLYATGILPAAIVATSFTVSSVPSTGVLAPTGNAAGFISSETGRSLYQTLFDFLVGRTGLGIDYDLFNPTPVTTNLTINVYVKDNYRVTATLTAVDAAVTSFFSARPIGDPFYYADLEQFIFGAVPGVRNVAVARVSTSDTGLRTVQTGQYFTRGVITIVPQGGGIVG